LGDRAETPAPSRMDGPAFRRARAVRASGEARGSKSLLKARCACEEGEQGEGLPVSRFPNGRPPSEGKGLKTRNWNGWAVGGAVRCGGGEGPCTGLNMKRATPAVPVGRREDVGRWAGTASAIPRDRLESRSHKREGRANGTPALTSRAQTPRRASAGAGRPGRSRTDAGIARRRARNNPG